MSCTAKVWKVRGPLIGDITKDDFMLQEEKLPALRDGEFLAETLFLSVDPYMKAFGANQKSGEVVASIFPFVNQVARVIQSKNSKFPVNTIVASTQGWRSHFISDGKKVTVVKDLGDNSPSHALGALGMPGLTAYCSLVDGCQPKAGEVLVVNAAAGAVGYLIVQIAKALDCKVIAYAGTDGKCKWLKELGADYAFNYKETDLAATLEQAAPDGIDCFIDHVGGDTLAPVFKKMRVQGRVVLVGAMSQYNKKPGESEKFGFDSFDIFAKNMVIKGFSVASYCQKEEEVTTKLIHLAKEGKVKFRERVVEGLDKTPDALLSLFKAEDNYGKVVVKV